MSFLNRAARGVRPSTDPMTMIRRAVVETLEPRRMLAWSSFIAGSYSNEGDTNGAHYVWAPAYPSGVQDHTATLTFTNLPSHTHVRTGIEVDAYNPWWDYTQPTFLDVSAQLASQSFALEPYGNGTIFLGEATVRHTGTSVDLSVTGSGFSGTDWTWELWGGVQLDIYKPVVSISGGGTTSEGGEPLTFTVTRDGDPSVWDQALSVSLGIGGTASTSDHSGAPSPVTIPANSGSVTFSVSPINDTLVEPTEDLNLSIQSSPSYTAGSPSVATMFILDNEPTVSVAKLADASETGPTPGAFRISRQGDTEFALEVGYTLGGSATGLDYMPVTGRVTIPSGSTFADVTITPIDDRLAEGSESVELTITPDDTRFRPGSPMVASLTIADNEAIVSISSSRDSLSEEEDTATITVMRTGNISGTLEVFLTRDSGIGEPATEGEDYLPLAGSPDNRGGQVESSGSGLQVTIPDGYADVSFAITTIDDTEGEPDETIGLRIDDSGQAGYLASPLLAAVALLLRNEPLELNESQRKELLTEILADFQEQLPQNPAEIAGLEGEQKKTRAARFTGGTLHGLRAEAALTDIGLTLAKAPIEHAKVLYADPIAEKLVREAVDGIIEILSDALEDEIEDDYHTGRLGGKPSTPANNPYDANILYSLNKNTGDVKGVIWGKVPSAVDLKGAAAGPGVEDFRFEFSGRVTLAGRNVLFDLTDY